jgi:hypothetical protein
MYSKIKLLVTFAVLTLGAFSGFSQKLSNGQVINTITTAVPFLRIPGDTRSGGMGDIGVAISPDANGAQLNGSKMAFLDQDYGVGLSFTPWLKSLVGDIYLSNLTAFYRIKKVQTIHASIRYFSLGNIQYTDELGSPTIQAHPNEFYFDGGYSRKLNDVVAVGATLRFIYSNIAPSAGTSIQAVKPGIAGSADISVMVDKVFSKRTAGIGHELLWGLCISNIGSKMTYTSSVKKDFIPTNMGMGFGYKMHFDSKDEHTLAIYAEFNKLLVPTPQFNYDTVKGVRQINYNSPNTDYKNESPITGMITSFYDAQGGASEELRSISTQVGAEYFYKKTLGLRVGYFYEDPSKGNRNFLTVGATINYNIATLHMSYLVPTSNQRNPLDNTFSFSLAFQFSKGGVKKKTEGAPEEAAPTPEQAPTPKKGKKNKAEKAAPPTAPEPSVPDPTKQ